MSAAIPSPTDCCHSCSPCGTPIDFSLLVQQIVTTGLGIFNVKSYGATGDGITDDTNAILATIVAANGGGIIFFPDGEYFVQPTSVVEWGATFLYQSDFIFVGSGKAKILVGDISAADHYSIFGPDKTALPISNVQFHNLRLEGKFDPTVVRCGQGIGFAVDQDDPANSVEDVVIDNCYFKNFGSAIFLVNRVSVGSTARQVRHVRITNSFGYNCPGSFATVDGDDVEVSSCTSYGYSANPALAYDAISCHCGQNILISNNKFYDCTTLGNIINIRNNPDNFCGSKNVNVIGNVLSNCRGIQISLAAGETVYGVQNVSICGNVIQGVETGVYITLQPGADVGGVPFAHFTIDDNTINAVAGIAIACTPSQLAYYFSICGNNITAACPGYGIWVVAASSGSISNNVINCASSVGTDRVLNCQYVDGVSILGNHFVGAYNATETITVDSVTDTVISSNFFYNKWLITNSYHLSFRANSVSSPGTVKEFTMAIDPGEIQVDILNIGVSAIPTDGTWKAASVARNVYGAVSGQPQGWVCTTSGTFGTLVAVTANTLLGSAVVNVSSASNVQSGQFITIGGVTGVKQITVKVGNTLYLDSTCDATVVGGAVQFNAPLFAAMANFP